MGKLCHADLHVVNCTIKFVQEIFKFVYFSGQLLNVLLVTERHFLRISMLNHQFGKIVRILVRLFGQARHFTLQSLHGILDVAGVEGGSHVCARVHLSNDLFHPVDSIIQVRLVGLGLLEPVNLGLEAVPLWLPLDESVSVVISSLL